MLIIQDHYESIFKFDQGWLTKFSGMHNMGSEKAYTCLVTKTAFTKLQKYQPQVTELKKLIIKLKKPNKSLYKNQNF